MACNVRSKQPAISCDDICRRKQDQELKVWLTILYQHLSVLRSNMSYALMASRDSAIHMGRSWNANLKPFFVLLFYVVKGGEGTRQAGRRGASESNRVGAIPAKIRQTAQQGSPSSRWDFRSTLASHSVLLSGCCCNPGGHHNGFYVVSGLRGVQH